MSNRNDGFYVRLREPLILMYSNTFNGLKKTLVAFPQFLRLPHHKIALLRPVDIFCKDKILMLCVFIFHTT